MTEVPTLTKISREDKDKISNCNKVKDSYALGMESNSDVAWRSKQGLSEELKLALSLEDE